MTNYLSKNFLVEQLPSLILCLSISIMSIPLRAADIPEFTLEIKDHLFNPSVIEIPPNIKVKIIIYNRDSTSEEFESYELNREKIIMGGRKATIFIGPLEPGEYPFFGEFNPKSAQGKVVVKEQE